MSYPLFDFQITGMKPFITHGDCANECFTGAHALLQVLEDAYRFAPEGCEGDGINNLNNTIKADAIQAIGRIIAMGVYHADCADEERRAKPAAVAA